ncbi:MAG: MBL fold metallo-hydrolase [Myxococcota bacterium]|nr:MBL fold metallo-hydrolase [Myxococcota bacterium]
MKFHHLRNATFVIESGDHHILIDPMLSQRGALPPFARIRHRARRNPTVPLPDNASEVLEKVTHCLITHSQTFGIRALQHSDHLDAPGEMFLREKSIPVICQVEDGAYLKKYGLNVVKALPNWERVEWLDGEITPVPAQHGRGWIHRLMANGAGYLLCLPDEPSIYVSGDTVLTQHVERALTEFNPDVAVVAAGSASLDLGAPILMPLEEIIAFVEKAPRKVIANHLEALNHCPTTRSQLKQALQDEGLLSKVFIPHDGETLIL